MALKETKGQQAKKATGLSSSNAESVLKLLQGPDVAGLTQQLKAYVAPLNSVSGPGKENTSKTELHRHAKQFVPFLVQLLKLCSANVATAPAADEGPASVKKGDEVFAAMEIALDSLDTLRSFLTGSAFEIEIQRCALVRRLLAWRRHSAALAQCKKNFNSLHVHLLAPEKDSLKKGLASGPVKGQRGAVAAIADKRRTPQNSGLPLPQHVEMATGLPTLVAGITIDVIWCTGESGPTSSESYQTLLPLPQQLEPWLQMLDRGAAEKQRDTLFRALYKCALILAAKPGQYGPELVQKFCLLTLQHCASSSLWRQYPKVVCKICHCLSCHGAQMLSMALGLNQTAMKTLIEKSALQGQWDDADLLELVDSYARLCQTAKRSLDGWSYICNVLHHIQRSFPSIAPVVGLYAAGLIFSSEDALEGCLMPNHGSKSTPEELGSSSKEEPKVTCYDLLQGGAGMLEGCLQHDPEMVRRKDAFRLLKALELIRKNATKYAQGEWASFITEASRSSSKVMTQSSGCNAALQRVLCLWFQLVKRVSSYSDLTREEEAVLKQSWSLASAPVVSCFRLSLILQQGVQDCITFINDLMSRNSLQPDELRWIMASTYNMGIQIFNNKDFESACYPFRVAYDVAWARVSVTCEQNLTQLEKANTNMAVNDFIMDSCVKCLTFADALKRSGNRQAGFEILGDGLLRWAAIHSTLVPYSTKIPSSLVRVWFEMLHTDVSLCQRTFAKEYPSLYTFLKSRSQGLSNRTLGLLMEEELLALDDLESKDSEDLHSMKEQQLQCLLDNVYKVEMFPVERCRILLEKGRLARLRGDYDVASLTEVVSMLNSTLEEIMKKDSDSSQIAGIENQLAMSYCLQALCAYESNPAGQEYLDKIFSALTVWEKSAEAQRTWITLDAKGHACMESQTAIHGAALLLLLFSIHDLLALNGYAVVQSRVQQLIVSLTSAACVKSAHELFASLWGNARLSHVLCPISYPSGFFSLLSQKWGQAGDCFQFWKECALLYPGTSLDARLQLMYQDIELKAHDVHNSRAEQRSEAFKAVEKMALTLFISSPKSIAGVSKLGVLFHILAEQALDEGDPRVALKYAKEALQLRLRLVSHMFHMGSNEFSHSQTENLNSQVDPAEAHRNIAGRLGVRGSVATLVWPTLKSTARRLEFDPSPWRVLGDYVESLMQVGVTSEKLGAVDDALHSFREGYTLSLSQQMPLAQAAFESCLGEVHRRQHHWEAAESDLSMAKEAYESLESAWICSCCSHIGQACVFLRLGDLTRRKGQREESLLDNFGADGNMYSCHVLSLYNSANHSVAAVLKTVNKECGCTVCASASMDPGEILNIVSKKIHCSEQDVSVPVGGDGAEVGISVKSANVKIVPVSEDQSMGAVSFDKVEEAFELDLAAPFSQLKLTPSEGEQCDEKVPVKRRGRPRKIDTKTSMKSVKARNVGVNECDDQNLGPENGERLEALAEVDLAAELSKLKLAQVESVTCVEVEPARRRGRPKKTEASCAAPQKTVKEKPLIRRGRLASKEASVVQEVAVSEVVTVVKAVPRGKAACKRSVSKQVKEVDQDIKLNAAQVIKTNEESTIIGELYSQNTTGELIVEKDNRSCVMRRVVFASMDEWIAYKWTRYCHQQLARVKMQTGKLYVELGDLDRAEEIYEHACYILGINADLLKSSTCPASDSVLEPTKCNFPIEEATLLYHKSHLQLQIGDHLRGVMAMNWLVHAFNLSTRSPPLLRKISKLLSILHVPVACGGPGLLQEVDTSTMNERAAYFHQVSVGAGSRQQHLAVLDSRLMGLLSETDKGSASTALKICLEKMQQALSVAPINFVTGQLTIMELLKGVPCNLCCISLVDREMAALLKRQHVDCALQSDESSVWVLITRSYDTLGPVTVLRPANPLTDAESGKSGDTCPYNLNDLQGPNSPVDSSTTKSAVASPKSKFIGARLQKVASAFASILDESRRSTSGNAQIDTAEEKRQWWRWRLELDTRLSSLLKSMEDSWLGPWKHLLAPETASLTTLEIGCTDVITGATGSRQTRKKKKEPSVTTVEKGRNKTGLAGDEPIPSAQKPLTLVLDSELQTLPWESLPVLRGSDTYRMPSIGSICALFIHQQLSSLTVPSSIQAKRSPEQSNNHPNRLDSDSLEELNRLKVCAEDPCVDPYNTFYVLNPSGDLEKTQAAFESWFKEQLGWDGKAGQVPTIEEYADGLQQHDLYAYLGHGSGDQYLPERFIRNLDHCPAALLMGCSSGRFSPRGDYEPVGVPLSYLMAGCPAAIANLWDVTDGDIDRFSRFLLHKWLGTSNEPDSPLSCTSTECTKELSSSGSSGCLGAKKSSRTSKKATTCDKHLDVVSLSEGGQSLKMGSFIGEGRDLCRLPYLIGASPVYYGVPTRIVRKETL